jgi:N-acetylglucosamine kinase-like BadF-type ATPase
MGYLLGVDGGNTKTLALIAQPNGTILGAGRAGCGDIYGAESPAAAIHEIEQAVELALADAGMSAGQLIAGAFSLAGADWPEDFAFFEAAMQQRGYGQRIMVVNDAIGALRAGTTDGIGVAIACGTGTAIGARNRDGRIWHSSFWQEPQGAGELSELTLRAVYRSELGIDPATALTEQVLAFFALPHVEALLHRLTARDQQPNNRHGLVRVLFDTADQGDTTAQRIVHAHGVALGDYALVAARQTGLISEAFPLVLTGGVLRHPSPIMRQALITHVQAQATGAQPQTSQFEPVAGALLLAYELAHGTADPQIQAQIAKSLPEPAFFAT